MEADAFEREVEAVIQEWGALLDRDAAAMIVVERHGRSVASFARIADLEEGMEANLRASVTGITPVRSFTRQDGTPGRVVNLELRDDSGFCRFVLWDEDGGLAAGALLALAIFLLVFSVLVFVPRLVQRGAVSFSVYSRRSIDEAEHAVRAVIEASGRTARVERPRSRARSPPRIVIAEEIPARFRLEVTRHAATTSDSGEWTEIIESLPNRQLEEAQALRVKIAERLSAVTSREE